jgi:hypothetical protein
LSSDTFWNCRSAPSETNEVKFGIEHTERNWKGTSAKKGGKLKRLKRNEHKYKREYEMRKRQPVYQHEKQQEEEN